MLLRVKISEEDLQLSKIERYMDHLPQTLRQLSVLAMRNDFSRGRTRVPKAGLVRYAQGRLFQGINALAKVLIIITEYLTSNLSVSSAA